MASSSSGIQQKRANTVLILGGWSPGPLDAVRRVFHSRCRFLEPSIPMPPMGLKWCFDPYYFLLLICTGLLVLCFKADVDLLNGPSGLMMRFVFAILCVVMGRICVARLVQNSIEKGVQIAKECLARRNVDVVIGFSWGGCVLAEMIRQGLVGRDNGRPADASSGHQQSLNNSESLLSKQTQLSSEQQQQQQQRQPKAILLAPTTSLVASISMHPDLALQLRRNAFLNSDGSSWGRGHIHVFHATDDGVFCPHSDRWEHVQGIMFHRVHDNHIFMNMESRREIASTLDAMLQ